MSGVVLVHCTSTFSKGCSSRSVLVGLSRVLIGVVALLLYLSGSHFIPDDYLLSAEFDVRQQYE